MALTIAELGSKSARIGKKQSASIAGQYARSHRASKSISAGAPVGLGSSTFFLRKGITM
jgi:hypothetical protein